MINIHIMRTSRNPSPDHSSSSSDGEDYGHDLFRQFMRILNDSDDDREETNTSHESEGESALPAPPLRRVEDFTSRISGENLDNEAALFSNPADPLLPLFQAISFRPRPVAPRPVGPVRLRPVPPRPRPSSRVSASSPTFHRRDIVPSHFLIKIESFPSLSKASVTKYRSEFEAGGHKWELSIFPNGDKKNGGEDHVSVFLRLIETSNNISLPVGWEVNAIFTFFVFDQIRDQYVTSQVDTRVMSFHSMKTTWGIPKFIDLKTFNDPSNGYLVNGTCTFGAEVFVVKNTFKGECLSMIEEPITCTHTWKVDSISTKTLERYQSEVFVGGDYKWRIVLYPNGYGEGKGNSISLFLQLDISTLPPNTKLFVNRVLRMKHQITNGKHFEQTANNVFSSSSGWGFRRFMSLAKFNLAENGFLLNDTCIIEAQFEVLGLIKHD